MHTYTLQYTPFFGRLAYWRISLRRQGGYHIGALIIAFFSLWGTFKNGNIWLSGFGIGVFVTYLYYFWHNMTSYASKYEGTGNIVEMQLHDDYYQVEHEGKIARQEWNTIEWIWKYPDMWFVFTKGNMSLFIIPTNNIDDEGLAFFEQKVLVNGGMIK